MSNSASQDFITLCLSGKALITDIEDFVDCWHSGKYGKDKELHEFLGMTMEEYGLWVEDSSVLPFIFDARKSGMSIGDTLDEYYHMPMAARASNAREAEMLIEWLKKTKRL